MYYDPSGRNGVSSNTNTDAEKNAQQENVTCDPDNDISNNPDGTTVVKHVKGFPDGGASKIKSRSILFPDTWLDSSIIDSIKVVGDTSPIAIRESDGSTLHRATVNGVQIEVMKIGSDVTAGYPTGGGAMWLT